jgi:hypothetical protein
MTFFLPLTLRPAPWSSAIVSDDYVGVEGGNKDLLALLFLPRMLLLLPTLTASTPVMVPLTITIAAGPPETADLRALDDQHGDGGHDPVYRTRILSRCHVNDQMKQQ